MPKTISFQNGKEWSKGHNVRDERYVGKQEHIDSSLTKYNVTICDIPVRQAYAEIFGQSVEEYNANQNRSDRRISDYYDKIKRDKRKRPVYECVVQIGDKDDTGNAAELEKQALIRFAEEWDKRNPNLRLIGAYVHCDEFNGTVHMHLDYIPVAKCTRGMRLQNSLDRALQQGFKSENVHQTAQIAWQDSEREALCAICRELGIDAQHNQGKTGGRKHLSKTEYIRAKEEQQSQIESELSPLKEELNKVAKKKVRLDEIDGIETGKSLFGGKVTVSPKDWDTVRALAKKEVTDEKKVKALKKERDVAVQERDELKAKLSATSSELAQYKQKEKERGLMTRDKLHGESEKVKLRQENMELRRRLSTCEEIIDKHGLNDVLKARISRKNFSGR